MHVASLAGLSGRRFLPVSGSTRSQVPTVTATASGSLCFVFRSADYSVLQCRSPVVAFWNGYCLGNGTHGVAAETPTGAPLQIRYAMLTGGPGTVAPDQTGATINKATFFGMLNDAAFVAAGGTVSGDGFTVTIPDGRVAYTDPFRNVTLAALSRYFHQIEEVYQTNQLRITGDNGSGTTHGDYRWTQTTSAGSPVYAANWGVSTGGVTPLAITGSSKFPLSVIGTGDGAPRSRIVVVEGDSINNGTNGYLGTYGERGTVKTALIAQGYSYVSAAASGTNISDMKNFGGYAVRMGLVSNGYAVITDHLHNDRGAALVPAGTFASKALPFVQWHNQTLRASAKPGARIIRSTLLPHTSSTDSWVTLANQAFQTPADGPTNWVAGYADYLMRRGAYAGVPFDPANDPDAAWDHFVAMGASAADYKWPVNGTTTWATSDGTHPNTPVITPAAADLQPRLAALIGF